MAESLAYAVYREAGVAAPRESYARVELAIDGGSPALIGLFSLEEVVNAHLLEDRFGDGKGRLYRLRHTFEDPFTSPPPGCLGPVPFPMDEFESACDRLRAYVRARAEGVRCELDAGK